MPNFHVTFYYLDPKMDGIPNTKDFGIINANNVNEAKEKVIKNHEFRNKNDEYFFRDCLIAKRHFNSAADMVGFHNSSLNSNQRKELIKVLSVTHNIEKLANFTDPELHEQWIIDCQYPNPYKNES